MMLFIVNRDGAIEVDLSIPIAKFKKKKDDKKLPQKI